MISADPTSPQRATDPRPARTRAAIYAAIDRLGTLGSPVTVAAIVAEAQISRSSFYSQFRDFDDVAVQVITALLADIQHIDSQVRNSHGHRDATVSKFDLFFAECRQQRGLYRAVLCGDLSHRARTEISRVMTQSALATAELAAPPNVDRTLAATFISAGVLAVTTEWLSSDEPVSEEYLLTQIFGFLPWWVVGTTNGGASAAGS